ncbi:hypothetical protein AB0F72_09235 [Actinoplanes sp. NPDC023936]|uniref:hypothetical protein n=1 Tax=Actinoplanes sp. NPDC023936 TaxID=3154910 RepID=UPI0033ECF2A7
MTGLCRTGKTAWPDQEAAELALADIRAVDELMAPGRKVPRRAYNCEFCSEWHLTSKPARRKGA